jgi:tRNA (guanine26-N2/guanine27-N2)-dimethyltransferase
MAGDRDLAIAFVRAWSSRVPPGRSGWEVAAATGVRGLRLLHEGAAFDRFRLTEANSEAAAVLLQNAARYPGAVAECRDARIPVQGAEYDYVDIDPYGTPAPFVPAALAAVRPNGVLAVTATDMMVLAGVQRGACERRYGARPVRGRLSPEGGLRILLAYLAREARARSLSVRPLLCYVRDHHARAYLQILPADDRSDPVGTVEPSTWNGPSLGDRGPYGPLWLGPLFDPELVRTLVVPPAASRASETAQFIGRLREEIGADVPFYYESNRLAGELGLPAPPNLPSIIAALLAGGFRAARTHARPEGFRTDAPRATVEAIARSLSDARQPQNDRVRA